MLVNEFESLLEATPFQPFRIYTADGRSALVQNNRHAWHAPADRTVFIRSGSGDRGRTHIIDLHLVSRFTIQRRPRGGGGNGNGRRKDK